MRKLWLIISIVLFVGTVSATNVVSDDVVVDLENNQVNTVTEVEDSTSSIFTYITSYPVEDIEAYIEEDELDCQIQPLQIGSEISCDVSEYENFTIEMEFTGSGFTSQENEHSVFRYTQPIYRPTDRYSLRVILPEGSGIVGNSQGSIQPSDGETGSTGRRIFVEWETEPGLGENLNFEITYEGMSGELGISQIIAVIFIALVGATAGWIGYRDISRENISKHYSDLEDDEVEIIELIRKSGGEMLQKDLVDQSDYSKAKISTLVSNLVEKELIVKEKQGRSNKVSIPKNYKL